MLQNWSFEFPLVPGQNIPNWTELPSEGSVTLIGKNYQAEGNNAALIGPNRQLYQVVSAVAGNTYTLTFWAGTHDPSQNETVSLEFLNGSGSVIGSQTANIDYDVDLDSTPPRIAQYTLQLQAPAGAVQVRVIVRNNGNNSLKFDAACLPN
jgi:hypothetical protein